MLFLDKALLGKARAGARELEGNVWSGDVAGADEIRNGVTGRSVAGIGPAPSPIAGLVDPRKATWPFVA